jgi:hypothetical protein
MCREKIIPATKRPEGWPDSKQKKAAAAFSNEEESPGDAGD